MEALLQELEASTSLVASSDWAKTIDEPEIIKQKKLDEIVKLSDLDLFLGLRENSALEFRAALKQWNNASNEIEQKENKQNNDEFLEATKTKALESMEILKTEDYCGIGLDHLTRCLVKQMQKKSISLKNVSDEVFKKELNTLVEDMHSRGLGLSSKVRVVSSIETKNREFNKDYLHASPKSYSDVLQYHTLSRLKRYTEVFSQLPELDAKFDEYLKSGECSLWDFKQKLYRGGDVSLERKTLRNIEKNKEPFRKDLINRGMAVCGYGQYYTTLPNKAETYSLQKASPVILTTILKPDIPLVNYNDPLDYFEKKEGVEQKKGMVSWKEYVEYFCNKTVIISDEETMFRLPNSAAIAHVTMCAIGDIPNCNGPKSVTELSLHRLDEDYRIKGHPRKFEKVDIPDETKLETTSFVALGHSSGKPLPVNKCEVDGRALYCVESPEKKEEYLLAKQVPESLKDENPTFIVEPSGEFLLQRKKQKLDKLQTAEGRLELEQQADENIEIIRSYFNMINDNKEGT